MLHTHTYFNAMPKREGQKINKASSIEKGFPFFHQEI